MQFIMCRCRQLFPNTRRSCIADSMFAALRHGDVLVHRPYESYDAVVNCVETAAHDPRVLAMKQTLYRTNTDSPSARALLDAASKKEVTVVVELKASFDEASNIRWARSFEDAGVQVFHGLVGLKTHAKLALVVREDPDERSGGTRTWAPGITIHRPRGTTP